MKIYRTKSKKLSGTKWPEVNKKALVLYKKIRAKTKRQPYIKSAYFNRDKIFLSLFWRHLHEKVNLRDKTRRIKYFPCAIELIQKSKLDPDRKKMWIINQKFYIVL